MTLTPWSPTPNGWLRYWRLPGGRDVVAARVYRNGPKRWSAYLRDPEGRELPGMIIEDKPWKQARPTIDTAIEEASRSLATPTRPGGRQE